MIDRPRQIRATRVRDVHLLALHEPYHSPRHPVPVSGTIVHALTLLHGLFWSGDGLVPPPSRPVLPWYRPAVRH